MIYIKLLCSVLLVGLIVRCEKDEEKSICNQQIIINEALTQSPIVDELTIMNVELVDNEIQLAVEYEGGCDGLKFNLVTNGVFAESLPVQLLTWLTIENVDSCNTVIKEDLCFDIEKLSEHYEQNYQEDTGTIILKIQGAEEDLVYTF